jgi:hypothetical protein
MLRTLLIAVVAILHVVVLIDCVQRHPTYFAGSIPRAVWIGVILLIPVAGPLAYMITMIGKPGPA